VHLTEDFRPAGCSYCGSVFYQLSVPQFWHASMAPDEV
jgi:hypothetical protein